MTHSSIIFALMLEKSSAGKLAIYTSGNLFFPVFLKFV